MTTTHQNRTRFDTQRKQLLGALATYCGAGLVAVPTHPDSKRPVDAWRDIETIPQAGELWRRHPESLRCGILTGPSSLVVVDIDNKGDEDGMASLVDWLVQEHQYDPGSARAEIDNHPVSCRSPSGGVHLYYQLEEEGVYPTGSTRGGVLAGVVSVPCRYIHSPISTLRLDDLENTIRLTTALVEALPGALF